MRFLADMGVSLQVVTWLRDEGHEATHLRDEGLQRLADRDIFAKAGAERRILVTFDLDVGEIAASSAGRPTGVVLFRLHNTRTSHVIDRLIGDIQDGLDARREYRSDLISAAVTGKIDVRNEESP